MVILHIIHSLGNGGAEKFAVELSNELGRENEVTLCSVARVEEWMLPPRKLSPRVKLIELGFNKKHSVALLIRLCKRIRRTRPDVVHVHSSLLVFYVYILSAWFRKIVFLQTIHNTITPGYSRLFRFLDRWRRLNRRFVNVCISQGIHERFRAAFSKLRFAHIDNGIEPLAVTEKLPAAKNEIENWKIDKVTRVFAAIGNYSPFKNFTMLVDVFSELERAGLKTILLLIGGGRAEDHANFSEVAKMKGANVIQLGTRENVADYLACSDALIMSSTKEGMPLVVLEALSLGLPVVSTPAGGVVDIIEHRVNGVIAKGFEKFDLLEAIHEFLAFDDDHLREIRENNKLKFSQRFSMAQCADLYMKTVYSAN